MKVELLAPGGSYESVIAAYNAGADAVYTGGSLFGARANADNLTEEQLIEAMNYAHIHGKKLYLTINTLLKDKEIEEQLYNYLKPLYENGLDAVIVQDMGVLLYIREIFPDLHIHASTQMTILGIETVKELEKLGVTRIVTPRELSLEEISYIKKNSRVEIESFVHGALCYCYSGQCFMSSYIGGRSGNRGRCAQPCRMEYDVIYNGKQLNSREDKYVLSPKDICALNILPEVINSGVYSLKIEGRMKKTEYIAGVVSIYRKYLDMFLSGEKYIVEASDINKLKNLFNRNGFNESYYKQHNGANMISLKKVPFRAADEKLIEHIKETYVLHNLKKNLSIHISCMKNKPFTIETIIEGIYIKYSGDIPSKANNKPLDKDTIVKQLSKTGNTNFDFDKINVDLDEGLFMPMGAINDARRSFICMIENKILEKYKRNIKPLNIEVKEIEPTDNINISVLISTMEQYDKVKSKKYIKRIYFDCTKFSKKTLLDIIKSTNQESFLALPFVFREDDKKKFMSEFEEILENIDGVLIRNIEQYFLLKNNNIVKQYVLDYNVYTENKYSKNYYLQDDNVIVTNPSELNYSELRYRRCAREEIIVYGNMPVMISANCALNTVDGCKKENKTYQIKDRLGNVFNTQCVCDYCYNVMYNCKPLSLFKYKDKIKNLNPDYVRVILNFEKGNDIDIVLENAKKTFIEGVDVVEDSKTTRTHFNKGVI